MGSTAPPTSDLELHTDDARLDQYSPYQEHLGLGSGTHSCAGGNLARMGLRALLTALLPRVAQYELVEAKPKLNNVLHGLGTCRVSVA